MADHETPPETAGFFVLGGVGMRGVDPRVEPEDDGGEEVATDTSNDTERRTVSLIFRFSSFVILGLDPRIHSAGRAACVFPQPNVIFRVH